VSPLRNGWPSCHGYTMTLVETQRFIDGIEQAMGEVFAPVRRARAALAAGDTGAEDQVLTAVRRFNVGELSAGEALAKIRAVLAAGDTGAAPEEEQ
jgi:hypothetical protein